MPQSFNKSPSGPLDYKIDWTLWLNTATIVSSSWAAEPSDITIVASSNDTTSASVSVSDGVLGQTYNLINTIVTSGGLGDSRSIDITIIQR